MTYLDYYRNCIDPNGYITIGHLQYKVINRVLYFQCSSGDEDWRSNFDFPAIPYKNMENVFYVHRGFLAMWKEARDIIATLDFDVIIGYSQGAVFASLAYEDTLFTKHVKCPCITFGSPRFLFMPSKHTKDIFKDVLRVKNPTDLVTHVPFVLMGFQHIGCKIVLENKAKKPNYEKWYIWASGHSQSRYLQNLEEVV